jgi:hypothetical protein
MGQNKARRQTESRALMKNMHLSGRFGKESDFG